MSLTSSADGTGQEHDRKRVQLQDFLRKDGVAVNCPDDRLAMEDTLIEGSFLNQELRPGLFVHVSDAREERAFTVTTVLREELSCIFFLDGLVDLKIGDRRFEFKGGQRGTPSGAAIMTASPEPFERSSHGGQHLRHLVISVTPDWLLRGGLDEIQDEKGAAKLMKDHLADHRWTLTPRAVELVRQIFAPSPYIPELRSLYLEVRAVEIVMETIAAVMRIECRGREDGILSRSDKLRLQRAIDMIAGDPIRPLTVESIAREAGTSTSGLQRLFHLSEKQSVFSYIRGLRLKRAFEALKAGDANVQQASAIAGYANPANFATAFKRQFGMTPRDIASPRRKARAVADDC